MFTIVRLLLRIRFAGRRKRRDTLADNLQRASNIEGIRLHRVKTTSLDFSPLFKLAFFGAIIWFAIKYDMWWLFFLYFFF